MRQWIDLYSQDLEDGLTFQLFKNEGGYTIIQADYRLDNESFYFLINYLKYPEGIEYTIDVEGFTIGKDDNQLKDKAILVYISPSDEEYDHVLVTTSENENFKVDFSGEITKGLESKTYIYPKDLHLGQYESILVNKKRKLNKQEKNSTAKLERRFKIIAAIVFTAFALTFLLFGKQDQFFIINHALAFAVFSWLFVDYKLLQVNKLYFSSVGLGLAILFYGYLLKNEFSNEGNLSYTLVGTKMPILFLTLQRPLRIVFKIIMKREPKLENPVPSFVDFLYIYILLMSTVLIPTFYCAE